MTSPSLSLPRQVRFRVRYETAGSLLRHFTHSVGQGSVALESHRQVPRGTRFLFELSARGVTEPVEVMGEVMQVARQASGRFLLNVRYDPQPKRGGLESVLQRIFEAHCVERGRKFPRIPLQVRATEEIAYSPAYLIRDVSRGGAGISVEAPQMPDSVQLGAPFLLEMAVATGPLALFGEVVWLSPPSSPGAGPGFGVHFGKLRSETAERLERLLSLQSLPQPPWRARVSFGMNAVSRMP